MRKKFRLRKILPKLILKEKTFSPKRLRDAILLQYNEETTRQNISNWFRRHPQLVKELKEKIGEIDALHANIRYEMDYWITKDLKSSIPIIQEWIDVMIGRKVSEHSIRDRVMQIRKICMGQKGTDKNPELIMDWKIHPLALTEEKALQFIAEYFRRGYDDHRVRLAVRNFLKYGKGKEPKKISGEKEFGKYGHLNAPKPKLQQILTWLTEKDPLIGKFCLFMYKTATRASASKNAKLSYLNEREKTIIVLDKGRKRQKQKWTKYLDDELLYALKPLIEKGALFETVNLDEARNLCREAYELFIPELAKEIPMPLHFWRHMFAQHMLRATNWNYAAVAQLGGWTDKKTLEDNYGKPPAEVVKQWGLDYVPMI